MVSRTIGMTDVPNMQITYIGAVTITTMTFNPIQCAVHAEVEKEQVTSNENEGAEPAHCIRISNL